jgi:hypothetical protein
MPFGFVNSAAIILHRCAWQGCYGSAQTKTRRFRSLWKAFHKERYAKVEVMSSSPWSETK